MEKAAVSPFWVGFMPNSPMPMLDACDWPLLTTVSTIRGGCTESSFLFCWLLALTGSDPRRRLTNLIVLAVLGGFVMTVGLLYFVRREDFPRAWTEKPWRAQAGLHSNIITYGPKTAASASRPQFKYSHTEFWLKSGTRKPASIQIFTCTLFTCTLLLKKRLAQAGLHSNNHIPRYMYQYGEREDSPLLRWNLRS
jgi:hypothetical protein